MSTLSVVIDASTRGTGAFAQMATSLAGVKAAADATNTSLDDTKVKTESTSSSMGLLSKANIDLATRFKDTRTQVDNVRQALVAHGVASNDATTATKGLFDQLARKGVLSDLKSALNDAGVSTRGMGSALNAMASELVNAQQQAEATTPAFAGMEGSVGSMGEALGEVGGIVMPALIGSMVSVGLATTPLIAAFTAWATITTGLAVGLAGLAATATIFLGGLGLIAGGMTALVLATQHWGSASSDLSSAQAKVKSATDANASAQQALQRAQADVNTSSSASASQLLTLQQAQAKATTAAQNLAKAQSPAAANANTAAQNALARAQLAVQTATTPTTSQTLSLQDAQSKAATASQNLAAAQAQLAAAEKEQNNPLQILQSTWGKVADTLGKAAVPAVTALFNAADQLAPAVQGLALAWINWYNSISPTVLNDFIGIAQGLLASLQQLTPTIEGLTNRFLQMWPYIQPIISAFAQLGAKTIVDLVVHLFDLSNWFLNVFPQASGIAGQGFSILGSMIQGIFRVGSQLVSWFIQNWPTISKLAKDSSDAFSIVFQWAGFIWNSFQTQLSPAIQFLTQHGNELKWVLVALASPILVLILVILGIVGIIVTFIQIIVQLIVWCEQLYNWFATNIPRALSTMGDYFSQFGSNAHTVWNMFVNEIQSGVNNIGGFFSALGSAVYGLENDFGNAFSAIGSGVQSAFNQVATIIDNFDQMVDNLPIIGGMLNLPTGFSGGGGGGGGSGTGGNLGGARVYARGGIVNSPTLGVFGEAGPEALIPLGGGPGNSNALNLWAQAGQALGVHGLGAGPNMTPGTWGGQCVVFVESVVGQHYPVAFAAQMASYVQPGLGPAAGEVFVSSIPPYGHTGIVLSGNQVIDSNWGLNELIQIHSLSDVPDIVGYFNPGQLSGLPAGQTLDVSSAMSGLVSRALGGAGGLVGSIANGMLNLIISGAKSKFGAGGLGAGLGGGRSSAPSMPSAPRGGGRGAGMGNDRVEALLASIDRKLATIAGAPSVGGLAAAQRIG